MKFNRVLKESSIGFDKPFGTLFIEFAINEKTNKRRYLLGFDNKSTAQFFNFDDNVYVYRTAGELVSVLRSGFRDAGNFKEHWDEESFSMFEKDLAAATSKNTNKNKSLAYSNKNSSKKEKNPSWDVEVKIFKNFKDNILKFKVNDFKTVGHDEIEQKDKKLWDKKFHLKVMGNNKYKPNDPLPSVFSSKKDLY
jgi:hypothetical protein